MELNSLPAPPPPPTHRAQEVTCTLDVKNLHFKLFIYKQIKYVQVIEINHPLNVTLWFNCLKATGPLQRDSLLFTIQFDQPQKDE